MDIRQVTIAFPLACLLLVGCQEETNQAIRVRLVKVETMTVTSGTSMGTSRYSGTVEEENGTPLSFATAGMVQTVHIRLGQRVHAGQVIATLDPSSLQSRYDAVRATLSQAEDAYRRMKELHDKGSLPDIKWVEVQSKREQARSMEQLAAKALRDGKLYAPFEGVIAGKEVEVGQNVVPGVPVAQLVSTSSLKVKIAVPETEIASVAIGQEAVVRVPALPGKEWKGRVVEKGIVAHSLSRSYEVKLQIQGAPDGLMPGMVTEVVWMQAPEEGNACVVPASIVQLDEQNRTFVWTIAQGKAHKRFIQVDEYTAEGVTVSSGLKAGDTVIVKGQQKVCEGTEVAL